MQLNKVLKGLMIALPVMVLRHVLPTRTPAMTAAKACWVPALVWMRTAATATCLPKSRLVCKCNSCSRTTSFTSIWTSTISVLTSLKCWMHTQTSCVATRLTKVTVEGHADERGTPEYNISLVNVVRTLLRCICRVKAFLLTRSPSFLTVKKNLQYWVMTKRRMPKPSCGTGLLRELHEQ